MNSLQNKSTLSLFIFLFIFGVGLVGCGFQLRGATAMPFGSLYSGFSQASTLGQEFKRQLANQNGTAGPVRILEEAKDAPLRLMVMNEAREKEIIGFSTTGRPREYQLRLRLRFAVIDNKEREPIAPTDIVLRRDVTTTDTQLIAREQEDVLLYRDMERDMVQQLLRRLAAIKVAS